MDIGLAGLSGGGGASIQGKGVGIVRIAGECSPDSKELRHPHTGFTRAAVEVAQLAALLAEKGNTNAVTDAGVAVLLAHAAAKGAAYNVRVNIQALEDKSKGQSLAREAQQLAKKAAELADRTTAVVERALSS